MIYKKIIRIKVILICVMGLFTSACSTNKNIDQSAAKAQEKTVAKNSKDSRLQYAGKQYAVTQYSKSGNYRFKLHSKSVPIPLGKIHQWVVKVETKAGEPVTNARLYVSGGMPAHRHGFPTRPVVKKHLGNGEYLVEGIKYTMPGSWEMRFSMKLKNQRERVTFTINMY